MGSLPKHVLVDTSGHPLSDRLQGVLSDLVPTLRRRFPGLKDEVLVTHILEEAGRRLADRERRQGPIERLHGYAWVTVRSVATSMMRRSSIRLERATLGAEESLAVLATRSSETASLEQIERDILFWEIMAQLSPGERMVCLWKKAGFSSREIAQRRGTSVAAVDTLFCRLKEKIRKALRGDAAASNASAPVPAGGPPMRAKATERS